MTYRIAPSMLSADFGRLKEEVQAIEAAGADLLHFDVMDNHYVPNLTVGPMVCKALRPHIRMPIDVHLMVSPVDSLAVAFADAGADIITFHPEASPHVDRTLQLIRSRGCKAGLVFNPATPLSWLDYTLDQLDIVLLMSVNPGFGGQSFIEQMIPKIERTRTAINAAGLQVSIQVDGGISRATIERAAEAGADVFVAGSAVYRADDALAAICQLREAASSHRHDTCSGR